MNTSSRLRRCEDGGRRVKQQTTPYARYRNEREEPRTPCWSGAVQKSESQCLPLVLDLSQGFFLLPNIGTSVCPQHDMGMRLENTIVQGNEDSGHTPVTSQAI